MDALCDVEIPITHQPAVARSTGFSPASYEIVVAMHKRRIAGSRGGSALLSAPERFDVIPARYRVISLIARSLPAAAVSGSCKRRRRSILRPDYEDQARISILELCFKAGYVKAD